MEMEALSNSVGLQFEAHNREEIYSWIEGILIEQEYHKRSKKEKGVIRSYLSKTTGLSMPQITRLVRQHRKKGKIELSRKGRRKFPVKYTRKDIGLLAKVDQAHEQLSGPATRKIMEREFHVYGREEFERLAGISVAHLYNLRQRSEYRNQASEFIKTKPAKMILIGERRRPETHGRPGYIRVDTVHQGDRDGVKSVYHINAVDTETQWETVGCTSKISEAYLIPILEAMLHQFPFRILGFHSDNGSEFINHTVANLLNKLLIEFTKSRANRTQDNAQVEGKNGAIIRKAMGYEPIESQHAEAVQKFYTAYFNRYLNFHRPCGFATVTVDKRGKRRRVYKTDDYATPYEKLKSLPEAASYLKPEVSFDKLDRIADAYSDTEFAQRLATAKAALLRKIRNREIPTGNR